MQNRQIVKITLISSSLLIVAAYAVRATQQTVAAKVDQVTASSPSTGAMFIENVGQFDDEARFQLSGSQKTTWLTDDSIWITLLEPESFVNRPVNQAFDGGSGLLPIMGKNGEESGQGVNIQLTFVGANANSALEGIQPISAKVSYLIGNKSEDWRTSVPVWGGVRYVDLYPGVDLELGMRDRLVCKTADCEAVLANVAIEVKGADFLTLSNDGLLLDTAIGEYKLPWFEVVGAEGQPLVINMAEPQLENLIVSNPLSQMNVSDEELFIGPNLAYLPLISTSSPMLYGTFLGGGSTDGVSDIAVDDFGSAYITGATKSTDFPTTPGSFDISYNGYPEQAEAYVVKLNPAGNALEYATFIGGTSTDSGAGIVVDNTGSVYVVGTTGSSDFPTTPGSFMPDTETAWDDAFVIKLNPLGDSLAFGTYLGGYYHEKGRDIAVDDDGNIYLTGETQSGDFPVTPNAFDETYNAVISDYPNDAFVAKLNPTGSTLVFATYLGGYYDEYAYGIGIDGEGNAYVTGETHSDDFPTTPGAYNPDMGRVFVSKFDQTGSSLVYSTYLDESDGWDIAVDDSGYAYVTGSRYFPLPFGVPDTRPNGGVMGASVVKLNQAGSDLVYSTVIDEALTNSYGFNIAVDVAGNAYIAGQVTDNGFPTTSGAISHYFHGGIYDAFFTKLNTSGDTLVYSTYLGGNFRDSGLAIAVDDAGNAYIGGFTESADFPITSDAYAPEYNGGNNDGFVIKIQTGP